MPLNRDFQPIFEVGLYKNILFIGEIVDEMRKMYNTPPPPQLLEIYGRLRCRLIKNNPRRTSSTPAGVFYSLLASVSPISKRHFSTDKDVRQIEQNRVWATNSQSKNGHGCSFLDEDGGDSTQQRCFCIAKTRHQPMYMDVHWLMRYLYRLFSKASISKALVLFRSVNNIYAAAETHLLLIIARECASFRKLFISSISTYINSG